MPILGKEFISRFTDFKEFLESVEKISNEEASSDKKKILNENRGVTSKSNISIDFSNRIYLVLRTGEKVRSILYLDNQISPNRYFSESQISPENLNRYHLYKCPTVDNLFEQNLKFSLIARDDNLFKYSFFSNFGELLHETNYQELIVCKSCLAEFNIVHRTDYTNYDFKPSIYFQMDNNS